MRLRYERKYLVKNDLLEQLRKRFIPFLVPDLNAEQNELKSEYTVRSVYFDTPEFEALSEKTEGLENRLKLRIRGYNDYFSGCEVFLEIKLNSVSNLQRRFHWTKVVKIIEHIGERHLHLIR